MTDFAHLQNGSDIRGIAIATDELAQTLTPEAVAAVASGFVNWLKEKTSQPQLKVGVGRDSRLSGAELAQIFIDTLLDSGIDVIDFGMATTPAMFMATQYKEFDCDAGVMLTASHLPYYFNGIKFFTKEGGAEHEDIDYILAHSTSAPAVQKGQLKTADILTPYAVDLVKKIKKGSGSNLEKPLANLKLIVDAGNGAGGFFAEKVLQVLGADTTGSQFLDPDGTFPNHIPNPDNKEAMSSIQAAVLREKADLGIIFDTDVDRAAVVTKTGEILNRNNLIAILSQIIITEYPGTSIVTNSPTSDHLKVFIEELGGKQIRYISGYRNVINRAIQANEEGVDCQLAIETSGHAAFKENYFLDDGTYAVAKILMLLPNLAEKGHTVDDLIANLKQPVETQEVRFKLEREDFKDYGQQIIAALEKEEVEGWTFNPENEEGVRFTLRESYGHGWFLLRMSLHEPLLVLQVENDEPDFMPIVLGRINQFLTQYVDVNRSALLDLL